MLDRWSIPLNTPIGKLSGGEKQRLSIIRALAHDPDVLVLDEPVASLDPAGRRDFLRELVERTIENETTVVLSTHILSDLERVASDVAIMVAGKIILHQVLDTLTEHTHRVIGPTQLLKDIALGKELKRVDDRAGNTTLLLTSGEADQERIDAFRSKGIRVEAIALEDLFIEISQ